MTPDPGVRPGASGARLAAGLGDGAATQERPARDADPRDLQRFKQALDAGQDPNAQEDAAQANAARLAMPSLAPSPRAALPPAGAAPVDPHLWHEALQAVSRLLVGARDGRRQVRVTLDEEVLPGVSIVIDEAEGRLQVEFTCSVEASRLRLNEALPRMSPALAQRLARPVLMRTQTDDPEDPHAFEIISSP